MKHSDFEIGQHFICGPVDKPDKWRCTDIGTRVIVGIKIESSRETAGWYNGPPYHVAETVFDEDDFSACEAAPKPTDETVDLLPYRIQQEWNGRWSAYYGEGFRFGPERDREKVVAWVRHMKSMESGSFG